MKRVDGRKIVEEVNPVEGMHLICARHGWRQGGILERARLLFVHRDISKPCW
jgi:hypothetical protein